MADRRPPSASSSDPRVPNQKDRGTSWLRRLLGPAAHDGPSIQLWFPDEASKAEAAGATVAHLLSRPDSIRQRAQNAATISSAVAAALVIAAVGHIEGSDDYSAWTVGLVFAAIFLWALSAAMFVYAVAFVAKNLRPVSTYEALIREYERYADKVRRKMRAAALVSAFALSATVLAVVSPQFVSPDPAAKRLRLILTGDGASVVATLAKSCGWKVSPSRYIDGKVSNASLTKSVVQVEGLVVEFEQPRKPSQHKCDDKARTLQLPRSSIRGVIAHK